MKWYMVLDKNNEMVAYGILRDLKNYIGNDYILEEM